MCWKRDITIGVQLLRIKGKSVWSGFGGVTLGIGVGVNVAIKVYQCRIGLGILFGL